MLSPLNLAGALAPYLSQRIHTDTKAQVQTETATGIVGKIFSCPADHDPYVGFTAKVQGFWTGPTMVNSYGFNESFLGWRDATSTQNYNELRGHLTQLKDPARIFLMCDAIPRNQDFTGGWLTFFANVTGKTLEDAYFNNGAGDVSMFDPIRHRGRINIVFADAHAETKVLPKPGAVYDVNGPLSQALITAP
jgi:prepilin-type processing-associated H-X9-DG protein